MIEELDADKLLAGPLGQFLAAQQEVRERAKRTSWWRGAIAAAFFFGVFAYFMIGIPEQFSWVMFGFPFVAIGLVVWAWWPRLVARQQVKMGINKAIADAVGLSYSHKGEARPLYDRLRGNAMLPSHNRQRFDDFWEGEIAGQRFRLFEMYLGWKSDDKERTKFHGPVMTFDWAKPFHGTTIIQRAGSFRREEFARSGKQFALVDMANPHFEDRFCVFSTDQVEARWLVDPAYAEHLVNIERAFGGVPLRALFCDNELLVLLDTGNLFESGDLDASKDRDNVARTIGQLRALARFAQAFTRR